MEYAEPDTTNMGALSSFLRLCGDFLRGDGEGPWLVCANHPSGDSLLVGASAVERRFLAADVDSGALAADGVAALRLGGKGVRTELSPVFASASGWCEIPRGADADADGDGTACALGRGAGRGPGGFSGHGDGFL